jgi:hypothetical protein
MVPTGLPKKRKRLKQLKVIFFKKKHFCEPNDKQKIIKLVDVKQQTV